VKTAKVYWVNLHLQRSPALKAKARNAEFERLMLGPEKRRAMLEQAEARGNLGGGPQQY